MQNKIYKGSINSGEIFACQEKAGWHLWSVKGFASVLINRNIWLKCTCFFPTLTFNWYTFIRIADTFLQVLDIAFYFHLNECRHICQYMLYEINIEQHLDFSKIFSNTKFTTETWLWYARGAVASAIIQQRYQVLLAIRKVLRGFHC